MLVPTVAGALRQLLQASSRCRFNIIVAGLLEVEVHQGVQFLRIEETIAILVKEIEQFLCRRVCGRLRTAKEVPPGCRHNCHNLCL